MPQMAPLNWSLLFIFFFILFILFFALIYFFVFLGNAPQPKFLTQGSLLNWRW